MTVAEFLERASSSEIEEWSVFWRLEAEDRPKP